MITETAEKRPVIPDYGPLIQLLAEIVVCEISAEQAQEAIGRHNGNGTPGHVKLVMARWVRL